MVRMSARMTARQTAIESDALKDAAAAAEFAESRVLELPNLFEPDVRVLLARTLAESCFVSDEINVPGDRLRESSPRTGALLCWLLGRPSLLQWIEAITATVPLAAVVGTTARYEAGHGHRLDWHNDLVPGHKRMLGVTVNLGMTPYEGGRFEIKRRGSEAPFFQHLHVEPYSVLVFAIGKTLMHRVTPVTAGGPRIVFGGWFLSEPPQRDARQPTASS